MSDEPEAYQFMRLHGDIHVFVVCYADKFYADVPYHVRRKGNGTGRGDVVKLKPELRARGTPARQIVQSRRLLRRGGCARSCCAARRR
jgi:hypothetical protein